MYSCTNTQTGIHRLFFCNEGREISRRQTVTNSRHLLRFPASVTSFKPSRRSALKMKIPKPYSPLENRTLFVISDSELVPQRLVRDKVINEHASGQTGAVIRQTRQNKSPGGDGSYVWHSMRSARGNMHIPLTKTLATNCGIAVGSRRGRWQISLRQQSINQCFVY
jgi:hypothetical protein